MKHSICHILGLLALVWGCSSSDTAEFVIEDAPKDRVCELISPDPLGRLMSLYILDENHFVVNTTDAVSLYGMDGTFCAEFNYESAINDFRVDGDMLYIYTAGGRSDHIIDVMNLRTGDIKGLCPASEAHKTSLSSVTGTALNVYDGHLLFAPKDKLEILTYSPKDTDTALEKALTSDSFKIQEVDNAQDISRSRKSLESFLNASSRTVYTFRKNKAFFLVALEGTSVRDENNKLSNDGRYYSFYRMDGMDEKIYLNSIY